jgi:hypothetical protein
VAQGDQSDMPFALRLVFTEPGEWASFWGEHQRKTYDADGAPVGHVEPPAVDFPTERVVAVTLGEAPDACWAVRVTNATLWEGVTTLTVTTYGPAPGTMCAAVVTQPYAMVAIPNDGSEIAYRDEAAVGAPPEAAHQMT